MVYEMHLILGREEELPAKTESKIDFLPRQVLRIENR
jgi:hypothetical protein